MLARRPARPAVALSVSLGVHLAVAAWVVSVEPAPRVPPPRVSQPIEVEFIELERVPSKTEPGAEQPEPAPLPQRRGHASAKPKTADPLLPPVVEPAPPVKVATPRAVTLLPNVGVVGAPAPDDVSGRTLHPGELPSAAEDLEQEAARVGARVDGWVRAEVMAARVAAHAYDPAYSELRRALREATAQVPSFVDTDDPKAVADAFLQSWGAAASRYAMTGAAYGEPAGRREALEQPSGLVEEMNLRHPAALALGQFLAAGARLQEFADGRAGLELFALVEVTQHAGGALDAVRLIRPSGLSPFDAWVLERAKLVGATFLLDAGTRTRPLRSLWRFDAVMTFRRSLSAGTPRGRAAVGMLTMAALSLLSGLGNDQPPLTPGGPPGPSLGPRMPTVTGRFDELTGAVDVVDLTNPAYDCRVTLLEAD